MCYSATTMEKIGIRELKQHTSAVLRRVVQGEVIEVTNYGKPVARIVPLHATALEQLAAEHRMTPGKGDPREVMRALGPPLLVPAGMPSPSEILAELRADER